MRSAGLPLTVGYTGHRWDPAIGQYFAPFRYYNPQTARWNMRDPLNFVNGPNLYAYVVGNPIHNIDSLGLACVLEIMLVTAYNLEGINQKTHLPYQTADGTDLSKPGHPTDSVAVAMTPSFGWVYPKGSKVTVFGDDDTPIYNGTVRDKGAGNKEKRPPDFPNGVPPAQWIDIWLPGKKAKEFGAQLREVLICSDDIPSPIS